MNTTGSLDVQQLVNDAQRTLDAQYPAPDALELTMLLRTQYHRLFAVTEGFVTLRDKRILDIACGANKSNADYPPNRSRMYEPWFARFAGICGAKVIGVDRRQSDPDPYYEYQYGDFRSPTTLERYDAEAFDIVNNSAFLVAPSRVTQDGGGGMPTTPELYFHQSDDTLECIDDVISKQVMRILKEGGYYLYNESIYQKIGGIFVRLKLQDLLARIGIPPYPER